MQFYEWCKVRGAKALALSGNSLTPLLCQERGMYIHAPDPFYMRGINKDGMGYVETNWNLPLCEAPLPPLLSHSLMSLIQMALLGNRGADQSRPAEHLRRHLDQDPLAGVDVCAAGAVPRRLAGGLHRARRLPLRPVGVLPHALLRHRRLVSNQPARFLEGMLLPV